MASKNIELRVGVLVIAAIIIFVSTVIWIQGYRFGKENYKVTVLFDEVGSLSKGDPVMVSGIRMGKVRALELTGNGVRVELVLRNEVALKQDAVITVKNIGLMGERFIAVNPGKSEKPLDLAVPVIGSYDTGIPEVMGMMGEMISELRLLVHSIKSSIASDSSLNRFTRTVANFEDLSKSLSDYMKRNNNKLDQAAENFVTASAELKKIALSSSSKVDSTLTRLDTSSKDMKIIIENLNTVAKTARDFADNLQNGDGTLQMMTQDRRLYDDLRKTADTIDELVNDIRANPKKYINLTVRLF